MILYYTITAYHILKFAVHKLRYHPNDEAILLMPDFLLRKFSGAEKSGIFSSCIYFSWERNNKKTADLVFEEIGAEFQSKIKGLTLNDFSEINVCRAAFFFGSWLVRNRQYFNWFEEADGRLSQPEPIMLDDSKASPLRYKLAMDNGLYTGSNPYVLKKYVKMSAQLPEFYDPLAVDFDVLEEMEKLFHADQKKLLNFFDVPRNLSFSKNSSLMLTAHFCNIRVMTYEEHAICYQLTSDYYLNGYNLYYKVHPSDLMPYQSFMENVEIVPAHFPSELLTLVLDEPFEVGASVSSTGIYNISSICKRILIFNQEYIKSFWQNHRYYFCVKMMELFPEYTVCAVGVNSKQLENMIDFGGVIEGRQVDYYESLKDIPMQAARVLYVIGAQKQQEEGELRDFFSRKDAADIVLFLNEDDSYYFYNTMKTDEFVIKELQIKAVDDEYGEQEKNEHVVIFAEDVQVRRKVESMKFAKRLTQSGAELRVFPDMDKDTQILALKGMLTATEQQFEKIMDKNAEIMSQHRELENRIAQQEKQIGQLTAQLKKYEGDGSAKAELKQEETELKAELELYRMKLANKGIKEEIEKARKALEISDKEQCPSSDAQNEPEETVQDE